MNGGWMGQRVAAVLLSGLLFFVIYLCGFFQAAEKPLWLDEHYSVTRSITSVSYATILEGRLAWEGNNAPFFYMTQKLLCDLAVYDPRPVMPVRFKGDPSLGRLPFYGDPFANTYLRLIPIFLMALAPAMLFYYFYRRYSLLWGSFAALLCVSSWLFWWYGLEARPYIYFLTLTTLQVIVFLEIVRQKALRGMLWVWLAVLNLLLALTITTSVMQTALIGLWCALSFRHALGVRKLFLVFVVPLAASFYYFWAAVKGHFWFFIPLYKYYLSNMPWEVLAVSAVFLVYAGLSLVFSGKKSPWGLTWISRDQIEEAQPVIFLLLALSAACFILLAFLKAQQVPMTEGGAPFAHRYLINFVPVGVIAMTMFSRTLFLSFGNNKARVSFILLLSAVLAARLVYTYTHVHAWIGLG